MNRFFDIDRLNEVWLTLANNKRRSLLTAFGVFWGVFMLVIMLSMGRGITNGIVSSVESIPQNMCLCFTTNTTIPYAGFRKGRYWSMKAEDLEAVRAQIPQISIISPVVQGRSVNVVNGDKSGSYRINGVSGNYPATMPINIVEGRYINDLDVKECRKVVVLGKKIVDEVFKGKSPIGRYVMVGGISYQCIGVSESASNTINIGGREEETVVMPYTLVQRIYNMGDTIHLLLMIADSNTPIGSVEDQVRQILGSRHQISPEDKEAMHFINLEQMLKVFSALVAGLNILIWIVGLGTLMSGAIGVSNIVMIAVKERTTEIGVRRAIGAKPFDIVSQIMSESLVITFLAGVAGLMGGMLLMKIIADIGDISVGDSSIKLIDPMLSFNTAVAAFVVIIIIGLLAGLMPAARAMKIKAIDAIREE